MKDWMRTHHQPFSCRASILPLLAPPMDWAGVSVSRLLFYIYIYIFLRKINRSLIFSPFSIPMHLMYSLGCIHASGFPGGASGKEPACQCRRHKWDVCSIPGSGRSSEGEYGNPLQYSCLENPMDRGAWWAAVHRIAQSQTWLKQLSTHTCIHACALSKWNCKPTFIGMDHPVDMWKSDTLLSI